MGQLNFEYNIAFGGSYDINISNGTLSFFPFLIRDSISIGTFNILIEYGASSSKTQTFSLGLYSLTGSTLSIANSWSGTAGSTGTASARLWVSLTATSAAQNITPGAWWFGMLVSTSNQSAITFLGGSNINPANAFPAGFYVGRMTDSTNALPSSYATSNLDITGSDAIGVPNIILTA